MRALLPFLFLTACQGEAPPSAPPTVSPGTDPGSDQAAVATGAITDPATLEGEYRVAGIDGAEVDLPHAITVSITQDTIRYTSQCVTGAWRYRFEGGAIVLDPVREAVCDRSRYPEEDAIEAAFAAAALVRRTPENGIRISGDGRSVTLFSQ